MSLGRDIWVARKARPLRSLTLMLLCLTAGGLGGRAVWIHQRALETSRKLAAAWPPDRTTLSFPSPLDPAAARSVTRRLPPGTWFSYSMDSGTLWVDGTLPEDFFSGRGIPLDPIMLHRGEPYALVTSSSHEDRRVVDGIAFRIVGHGDVPLPADQVVPARSHPAGPVSPDTLVVHFPAETTRRLLAGAPGMDQARLVDHQRKRADIRAGFRQVQARMGAALFTTALISALVLMSLLQADVRERTVELALRRAMGATPGNLFGLILTEALIVSAGPAVVGMMIGTAGLSVPSRTLLATGVTGWILLCAWIPARTASRLSPAEALKTP